jgi:DNA (cytosine-5)-methyltransferase 1
VKIGSLFSGIGGLELGIIAENPGAEVVWQAECDPYALKVLERHFPTVRRIDDVRKIDASVTRPDVICGGFPCQPHSLAGKRRGTSDERWLWPEFARIVGAVRPSAVFIENVPGLRTSGLRDVLADLADLGFDAVWDCFTAAEVGAPQLRRRLFVFAYDHALDGSTWLGSSNVDDREGKVSGKRDPSLPGLWVVPSPEACRGDDGRADRMDIALLGNSCVPAQAALAWRTLTARAREVAA